MKTTDNKGNLRSDFTEMLAGLTDDDLVEKTEHYVWLSGYAANNPRSDYHWQCDACYDEANRRQKPWLYQRGWNGAWVSAGHSLSQQDAERAREP